MEAVYLYPCEKYPVDSAFFKNFSEFKNVTIFQISHEHGKHFSELKIYEVAEK